MQMESPSWVPSSMEGQEPISRIVLAESESEAVSVEVEEEGVMDTTARRSEHHLE